MESSDCNPPRSENVLLELFRKYETFLQHFDAGIREGMYYYAHQCREDAKSVLEEMKREPLMEKLEFILNLYNSRDLAKERRKPLVSLILNEYIRTFWDEVL
jgi:hypothetical protein